LEEMELPPRELFHTYLYPKFRSVKESLLTQAALRQGVQINE